MGQLQSQPPESLHSGKLQGFKGQTGTVGDLPLSHQPSEFFLYSDTCGLTAGKLIWNNLHLEPVFGRSRGSVFSL